MVSHPKNEEVHIWVWKLIVTIFKVIINQLIAKFVLPTNLVAPFTLKNGELDHVK
jgi:hypothetical protein